MSDKDLTLDDYPYSNPGYGRKVAVVPVGSCGCRIGNQLSRESKLLEHYVYVSCDDEDLANVTKGEKILINATSRSKRSPYEVRGLAIGQLPRIRKEISDSELIILIAGLGGAVGSGLAPLIAREAKDKQIPTVAIVVMPFNYDKSKHFFAGGALKQLREVATGVILVDNDELLRGKDMPAVDSFSMMNGKIALAIHKLLGSTEKHEFPVGLNSVVDFVKGAPYSVLCIGEDAETFECRKAVLNAASHFDHIVDKSQASRTLVHVSAGKTVTMKEIVSSVGGLSAILGNGTMQIQYGFSANSTSPPEVFIMATGFQWTRFDDYDPVERALGKKKGNLESGYDSKLNLEMLLPDLEST